MDAKSIILQLGKFVAEIDKMVKLQDDFTKNYVTNKDLQKIVQGFVKQTELFAEGMNKSKKTTESLVSKEFDKLVSMLNETSKRLTKIVNDKGLTVDVKFEALKGEIQGYVDTIKTSILGDIEGLKEQMKAKLEQKDIEGLIDKSNETIIDDEKQSKDKTYSSNKIEELVSKKIKDIPQRRDAAGGSPVFIKDATRDRGFANVLKFENSTIEIINNETVITPTGGGSGASSYEVTQSSHGFVTLDCLYFDEADSTFKKAQSDSVDTLGAWHVVEVVDANTFKIARDGVHEIPNTLDLGEYVLSSTVAGGYTQTLPGDLGDWVLYGMEVLSSTHISFYTVPAIAVGDTGDVIQSVVAGTGITVDNTDPLNPIINATGGGSGTVTSVAISGSDGIEIDSGSPVTTTGTIALGVNKTAMLTHLNVEDGAEVNNISDANATDLTDGNDTTLHTHDGRYYTETEIDTLLSGKVDENISITGATKTKITYDAKGLVTAGADATTADIADSSNKRYVTDADITKIGHITVTQAVDLDQMESDIAALANGMVYKGNWDASAGTFPGGGTAQAGRFYTVSVGGTVDSVVFNVDDRLVATVDNASATTYAGNWTKLDATDAVTSVFGRLGNVVATNGDYTASQITNVAAGGISAVTVQTAIDELDTEKAPKTSPTFATSINGSYLTASEILITDPSKNIVSAPVATYPSLAELIHLKGTTSAVQTQLNAKQPLDADLTTWSGITPGTGVATALGTNVGSAGAFVTDSSTNTLTNKRITPRVGSTTSSATPTINTDNVDAYSITALAAAITSFTTNLSGTPTDFQKLMIRIKDNGTARAITRGASFEAKGVALPTTTVISKVLTVGFVYDTVSAKWGCIASAQEA